MRVIIAGGRDFSDYFFLEKSCLNVFTDLFRKRYLTNIKSVDIPRIEIISGTARGADFLGEKFANQFGIKVKRFPANWELYGKRAGFCRNLEMSEYAKQDIGVLIAFWDGKSHGTKHMIATAEAEGLMVYLFKY